MEVKQIGLGTTILAWSLISYKSTIQVKSCVFLNCVVCLSHLDYVQVTTLEKLGPVEIYTSNTILIYDNVPVWNLQSVGSNTKIQMCIYVQHQVDHWKLDI